MQYVSIKFAASLANSGSVQSVGSISDSYDNALAETIIGIYRTAIIRIRGPRQSIAPPKLFEWFNSCRPLQFVRRVPPGEAGAQYYVSLEELSIGASPKQISLREIQVGPPLDWPIALDRKAEYFPKSRRRIIGCSVLGRS